MDDSRFGTADRLELLQTFIRIVETGSLSAAALRLDVSQPTVSRRLKALESMLGLRLIQRSTHSLNLTDDGERCARHARAVCERWASMAEDLQGMTETPRGRLRVLVPHAFGQDQLLELLESYLRAYPEVSVEWLLHDRYPDFIAEGIDCAIRVGKVEDPAVVAVPVAEVPRIVVASPEVVSGIEIDDIDAVASLPWLALRTFYRDRVSLTHADEDREHHFAIAPRVSTDNLAAIRQLAVSGFGAAIVSAWRVADDLESGRLIQLLPTWYASPLPVYLVYPYADDYPARLHRFIELIRAQAPGMSGMTMRRSGPPVPR
ncbi:LysR family transcriptional regulator [Salinicola halimionae]|uniref:LysR family transcriptional regulator n=1 Tax=Salinicola halimionae TaxID=1949081 RepID=UPI000DA1ADFA|nr:LysR family transcriptional regulator [Salinicola halimionae]